MALWPARKDQDDDRAQPNVPELPAAPDGRNPDDLQQLTQRLGQVGQQLDRANEQVVAYLMQRESQAAGGDADDSATGALAEKIDALAEKLDRLADEKPSSGASAGDSTAPDNAEALATALQPLQEKLERIETQLKSLGQQTPDNSEDALGQALQQVRGEMNQQAGTLFGEIRQLRQHVDAALQGLADQLRPEEPEEAAAAPASGSDWERAVLGPELTEHPALVFQRQQLLNGVLEGDPGACSLVGQLLVFRSATTEKMPPLLKEVGEAYYRWDPKTGPGSNPMEEALVGWLKETCEAAGVGNTIELVHPGERFDSTRHSAAARGVEITEVRGWIVLRDNGKVYTKAAVAVR